MSLPHPKRRKEEAGDSAASPILLDSQNPEDIRVDLGPEGSKRRRRLFLPAWAEMEAHEEHEDREPEIYEGDEVIDEIPYYQSNFELVLNAVMNAHQNLFNLAEIDVLKKVCGDGLDIDAQRLFLRLVSRKGPVFRLSQLKYDEINIAFAAESLVEQKFAFWTTDLDDLVSTMTVNELKEVVTEELGQCAVKKRDEVLATVKSLADTLTDPIRAFVGHALRLSDAIVTLVSRGLSLYFLSDYYMLSSLNTGEVISKTMQTLILTNMRKTVYPKYPTNLTVPVFVSRDKLLEYESALRAEAKIFEGEMACDLTGANMLSFSKDLIDPMAISCVTGDVAVDIGWKEGLVSLAIGFVVSVVGGKLRQLWARSDPIENPHRMRYLARFHAQYVYTRIVWRIVSVLEHEKLYDQAIWILKLLLGWWPKSTMEMTPCPLPNPSSFSVGKRPSFVPGVEMPLFEGVYPTIQPWCAHYRSQWWIRLCIDLEKRGRRIEALEACETALKDPFIPSICADRLSLEKRLVKLCVPPIRWKKPVFPAITTAKPTTEVLTGHVIKRGVGMKCYYHFQGEEDGISVEELALRYYASFDGGEWRGIHTEGSVFRTLFGIMLWDVIFHDDVRGVFFTPYQDAPMDLGTSHFATTPPRSYALINRLDEIRDMSMDAIGRLVRESWDEHSGVMCRGVQWDAVSKQSIIDIAMCIGGRALSGILWLLAQDRDWYSGLPDLLLWDERRHACKVVEVKSAFDRFSDKQLMWIDVLLALGMDVEVCNVRNRWIV